MGRSHVGRTQSDGRVLGKPLMSINLALFDLDHTLLPLDSDQAWAHFIAKLGVQGALTHARNIDLYYRQYVAGTLDMTEYLRHTLAPLAQHSREQLDAWHQLFMKEVIVPAILPAAQALVRQHREAGDLCCIVTATNVFVTAPIGKALGFDHLLGIELGTEGATHWPAIPERRLARRPFAKARSCGPRNGSRHSACVGRTSTSAISTAIRLMMCRCWNMSRIRSRRIPMSGYASLLANARGRLSICLDEVLKRKEFGVADERPLVT